MATSALSPGRERLAFVSQVLQGYVVEVQVRSRVEHTKLFNWDRKAFFFSPRVGCGENK